MNIVPSRQYLAFLPLVALFAGILGCARALKPIGPQNSTGGGEFVAAATATGSAEQTRSAAEVEAAVTAAAQQTAVVASTPTPEQVSLISEDFSSESTVFDYAVENSLQDGALLLGPSDNCSLDQGNFLEPAGCIAVCQGCSSTNGSYSMQVDWQYVQGVSEREFGVILRFVDENGDARIGDEDYILMIGMNVFENQIKVYLHEPGSERGLQLVESADGGFLAAPAMNRLEIISQEEGREMDVLINDGRVYRLRGYSSEPGDTFIETWVDSGAMGLILLQRGVQVRYDNFVFQDGPG